MSLSLRLGSVTHPLTRSLRRLGIQRRGRAADAGDVSSSTLDSAPPSWAPDTVVVRTDSVQVGAGYAATLAICGYPVEVAPGWLEPLLAYPGRLDVALHIDPVAPMVAAQRLRTQRARLESVRRADATRGRLDDPEVDAAADDAAALAVRVARGDGKLFRVGIYLTVHADTEDGLDLEVAEVRSRAAALLLDAKPVTWRALQGWSTSLPLSVDTVGMTRIFDTDALAAAFPFTSPDLPALDPTTPGATSGVLYGLNAASPGVVVWDRWSLDNHNAVVLARSGAGKSYFTKLELLRSLYDAQNPVHAYVIDPEDEYTRLVAAVGGVTISLGAPGVRLNPFDLPDPGHMLADSLTRQTLFGHTVVGVLIGEALTPACTAALDRAILTAYRAVGITADTRTWSRPAPLLRDVATALHDAGHPVSVELADRLSPYTTGSFKDLFDGPTTTRPVGHLVSFSLRDLPEELRPIGTVLALDTIWRHVTNPRDRRRRLVVVDEAWRLLADDGHGAQFLYRLAKSARKHWCGLTVVTQDAADVLDTTLGHAVINNAATHILLRQTPHAIDRIAETFALTAGERGFLLAAHRGEGLLLAGASHRVAFAGTSSTVEHELCTSDPAELLDLDPSFDTMSETLGDDGEYGRGTDDEIPGPDDSFGSKLAHDRRSDRERSEESTVDMVDDAHCDVSPNSECEHAAGVDQTTLIHEESTVDTPLGSPAAGTPAGPVATRPPKPVRTRPTPNPATVAQRRARGPR